MQWTVCVVPGALAGSWHCSRSVMRTHGALVAQLGHIRTQLGPSSRPPSGFPYRPAATGNYQAPQARENASPGASVPMRTYAEDLDPLIPKVSEPSARLALHDATTSRTSSPNPARLHSRTSSHSHRLSTQSVSSAAATVGTVMQGGGSIATSTTTNLSSRQAAGGGGDSISERTSHMGPLSSSSHTVAEVAGGAAGGATPMKPASRPPSRPPSRPLSPAPPGAVKHGRKPSDVASDIGKGALDSGTGFKVVVSQADDEDDSLYCPTCLELYTDDNPKTFTACGHHYHLPCLYEWLERKDTCPICDSHLSFPGMLS